MDASEHEANTPETPAAPPPAAPPSDNDWDLVEPPDTKWPKVIGIISLIYALGGLLCQVGGGVFTFLIEFFLGMGGIDVTMPMSMKIVAVSKALVLFFVGLILLFGSINLLRRRRSGLSLHKQWAIIRLVLVVVFLAVDIMFLTANVEFQRSTQEATNQMLRDNGQSQAVTEFSEDAAWTKAVIGAGVVAGVASGYPLFLGFYLSRKKITKEVDQWI